MPRKKPKTTQELPPGFEADKEAMLAAVNKVLDEAKVSNAAEAVAFLNQFAGMKLEDITAALGGDDVPLTEEEMADDLFFEAMGARTKAACHKKLQEALRKDPDHVRALMALAMTEKKPDAAERGLRSAIAAGERKLGPLLEEGAGQLWGFLEARPYMEARAELARLLAGQDERLDEAIAEHQELLRLNENDNQGMRDPLLGLLMEQRRYGEAQTLVQKYDTHHAATWMYAKAFLEFQKFAERAKWDTSGHDADWLAEQLDAVGDGGDSVLPKAVRMADRVLIKALKQNPWGAIYLMRASKFVDDELPDFYSAGGEDEARMLLEHHGAAWVKHPSALLWLMLVAMPWLMKNGYEGEMRME